MSKFLNVKNFLLDLFFPKFCLGCGKEGFYLCEDCKATLDISEFDYCLCNKNHHYLGPDQKKHGKCPKCQDKKLSGLYFALPYKEKQLTKKLIYQFKYEPYTKELAKILAEIIADHLILSDNPLMLCQKQNDRINSVITKNSVLIPIPLDKNKLRSRGYNQSEELAKELSKILKIPVISNILIKTKITKSQMELSKTEREKNLQGAFGVRPGSDPCLTPFAFAGKKIFLIDDVYTTGSTMEECARVLRDAGAKQVWGIAVAREE